MSFYEESDSWKGEMGWDRLLMHILPEAILNNMSNVIQTVIYLPDTENLRLSELPKQALSSKSLMWAHNIGPIKWSAPQPPVFLPVYVSPGCSQ